VFPAIESKTNGVVKFGIYEVNPRLAELRRNGVKVKLQEQPFQVLALLLEKPGEVVSRDDLQKATLAFRYLRGL
jgi:DNA-binding winged helix-turn-helix (wHTH) protein